MSRYLEGSSSGDVALLRRETAHQSVEERESIVVRLRSELLITPVRVGLAGQREDSTHTIGRYSRCAKEAAIHARFRQRIEAGRAWLVVQKNLGADSLTRWLTESGWPSTRLASRAGFRILEVTRS